MPGALPRPDCLFCSLSLPFRILHALTLTHALTVLHWNFSLECRNVQRPFHSNGTGSSLYTQGEITLFNLLHLFLLSLSEQLSSDIRLSHFLEKKDVCSIQSNH